MFRIQSSLRLLFVGLLVVFLAHATAWATDVPVRTGLKYFEVQQADGSYEPMLVKGMNIGAAMPGKFPSQFTYDEVLYASWIKAIGEMNANTIRLYTILPREFYRALRKHNLNNPDKPVWLIQGVWVSPPPERNFLDEGFMDDVTAELMDACNVVHGNATIHPRPGHAEGIFDADVSPWLLAWLVGREWEPDDIQGFHEVAPDYTTYAGKYISCYDGQPIECWLAELCDIMVVYEDDEYNVQRPVSFSSWPPTDAMTHISESNIEYAEQLKVDETEGRVDIFSNDAVNLTGKSFTVEDGFLGGLYASYHVYTYYPDFIDNDPEYQTAQDKYGRSNYMGYLNSLKSFYSDRPLLIAEFGLSNTFVPSHQQSQGWHHGGLSEQDVANEMPRLVEAIVDSGCAGGAVFAWIDEWWKKVWLWTELYDPYPEIRLWYNCLDAEQNFGMVALRPGEDGMLCTLSGNEAEWDNARVFDSSGDGGSGQARIESVSMQHDEGYLYVRVKLENFDDWDFEEQGLCLAFDVLDQELGNFEMPGPLNLESDSGMEVAIVITNGTARILQTRDFRYFQPYRVPYSLLPRIGTGQPYDLGTESNSRHWVEPVFETNRRRVGKDQVIYPQRIWEINPLPRGHLNAGSGYNDLALWNASANDNSIEIRVPWMLAGFVGPHKHRVLATVDGINGSLESEGVALAAVLFEPGGEALSTWPSRENGMLPVSKPGRYTWETWGEEEITFNIHYKPVYYSLKELFSTLDVN